MSKSGLSLPAPTTGPEAVEARITRRYGTAAAASGADITKIVETAKRMGNSGLMPQHIKSPEQAVIIGLRGAELGIPLIQAWHSMYVINGRAAMEAKTMVALAYKVLPGFDFQIVKLTREECVSKARRSKDHSWVEMSYDMEDAHAAGLTGKGPWKQHPKAMLMARCQAMLLRAVAPDTFQGMYTGDEIEHSAPVIEEGSAEDIPDETVMDAQWEESSGETQRESTDEGDSIDGMSLNEIRDAIVDGGLTGDAVKAREHLRLDPDDKSVDALRAIYRHVLSQMP